MFIDLYFNINNNNTNQTFVRKAFIKKISSFVFLKVFLETNGLVGTYTLTQDFFNKITSYL